MIPNGVGRLGDTAQGRAWLDSIPDLVDECARHWQLRLGDPYPGSSVSLVLPAVLPEGVEAILKIQYPHRESEHEAAALAAWEGDGAILLLDHDPERNAMLIERCDPGHHLSRLPAGAAIAVFLALLPRLWKQVSGPFRALADEAGEWIDHIPAIWERAGRPFERRMVDAAVEILCELSSTQGEQVLLHQDLHADNVLSSRREPWLAIDPKPLLGEREFGVAPIVRSYELGHGRDHVLGRLDRLTTELGLDRERARGWSFAHTLAWAFDDGDVLPRHVETAGWLFESLPGVRRSRPDRAR